MKRLVTIAVLLAPLVLAAGEVCAEPYATKLEIPAEKLAKGYFKDASLQRNVDIMQKALSKMKVPDRTAVPVPPYPGAKIFSVELKYWLFGEESPEPKDTKIGKPQCLPYIDLYSTDPMDEVLAFYKRELRGYKFTSRSESGLVYDIFWAGRDNLIVMDGEEVCSTPHVEIYPSGPDPYWPEVQTVIQIGYIPR